MKDKIAVAIIGIVVDIVLLWAFVDACKNNLWF